jgi:hypothetical protein
MESQETLKAEISDTMTHKFPVDQKDTEARAGSLEDKRPSLDVFAFIYEKVQKLSTAVYMVTSYIQEGEPVRATLRVLALSSVGHANSLSMRQTENHFVDIQKDISHIMSLIQLTRTLEIVSDMNAKILLNEYQKLQELVTFHKDKKHKGQIDLGASGYEKYYEVKTEETKKLQASPLLVRVESESEIKKVESIAPERKVYTSSTPAKIVEKYDIQKPTKAAPLIRQEENKERKNTRQNTILKLLSTDTAQNIKDITAKLNGCSEKTVQRELNTLVSLGKIKRLGEKRWSTYLKI